MKSIRKNIILGISLCFIIFLLSSCEFSKITDLQKEDKENKMTCITIYNDESPVEFTIKYGERASVTSFTKNGYYLTGYYSEKNGGNRYFDCSGESISVWQEGNPSVFYAQWKSLDTLDKYNQNEMYEDPFTLKPPFSTRHEAIYHFVKIEFTPEYINAIKGNLDKKIRINISYKVKGYNTYGSSTDEFSPLGVNIVTDTSTSAELLTDVVPTGSILASEYTLFNEERVVNTSDIKNGCYVRFNKNIGQIAHIYKYLKNLKISAEIIME